MQAFRLDPRSPNVLAGGKRPRTTLTPTVVMKDGRPFLAIGTPGGDSQDQQILLVLLNMIDFGRDVQAAIEAPRVNSLHPESSFDDHRAQPGVLEVEATLGAPVDRGADSARAPASRSPVPTASRPGSSPSASIRPPARCAAAPIRAASATSSPGSRMHIPFVKHTLYNGLDVIVHEDRGCPIVGVSVWYHVGSKNEVPGRTGFAHLFEHLMFEGSEHHDRGYFHPLQEAGASLNGSTNADRTNYWEVVPSNAARARALDGVRSHGLPAAGADRREVRRTSATSCSTSAGRTTRTVRTGWRAMALVAALYPADHPYHWLTIGSAEDLKRRGHRRRPGVLPDVLPPGERFARDRGRYRSRRRRRAGRGVLWRDSRRGPTVPRATVLPRATAPSRPLVLEDRVELPRLYLAWHTPALFADGDAELDLVADVLTHGKTSRLYRALVYEQRVATEVAASQNSRELESFFQIVATAAPGRTLVELERAITDEIERLASTMAPTAPEMERAHAQCGGALRPSAADGGRLRRQVRPAQRLQHVPRTIPAALRIDLARYRRRTRDDARRGGRGRISDARRASR